MKRGVLNLDLTLHPSKGENQRKFATKMKSATGWTSIFLAGLISNCGGPAKRANCDLFIYFTCDTRGRLEPCGCFDGQFGGLTRLKTVLDDEAPASALRLDVGDAIGGRED